MRVGIFGRGRLGTAVAEALRGESDMELAWAIDEGETPGGRIDVALDASVSSAVAGHIAWARESGAGLVVGVTGWDSSILGAEGATGAGIMVAPNFSLAIAFMRRIALALGRFAMLDPGSGLGVSERHHERKADAPSGTAKLLAQALLEGCPRYGGWSAERFEPGKLHISSLRCGHETGWHELRLDASCETLAFAHEARSRELFARGAVRALRWIRGREGVFSFDDMAAELIDPLFAPA